LRALPLIVPRQTGKNKRDRSRDGCATSFLPVQTGRGTIRSLRSKRRMVEGARTATKFFQQKWSGGSDAPSTILRAEPVIGTRDFARSRWRYGWSPSPAIAGADKRDRSGDAFRARVLFDSTSRHQCPGFHFTQPGLQIKGSGTPAGAKVQTSAPYGRGSRETSRARLSAFHRGAPTSIERGGRKAHAMQTKAHDLHWRIDAQRRDRADRQILIERPWKHLDDLASGHIHQEQIGPVLHILEARIGRRQSHCVPVGVVISRTRPEQRWENRARDPQAISIALRIDPRARKTDRMPRIGTTAEKVRGANANWPDAPWNDWTMNDWTMNDWTMNDWTMNDRTMNDWTVDNRPTDNWSTDDWCNMWGRPSGGSPGRPVLVSLGHGQSRHGERKYRCCNRRKASHGVSSLECS
jgi:hypothetical protein